MGKRYFVDERSGCIAVRDREDTDPEHEGLHKYTEGVVRYWHGFLITGPCKECGHLKQMGWSLKPDDVKAAHALCDELNEGEKA